VLLSPGVSSDAVYLEQLVRAVGGANGQFLQQLHHQPAEALERAWQADVGVDLNEHVFVSAHIDGLSGKGVSTLRSQSCRQFQLLP
jgi:hypothetical protein